MKRLLAFVLLWLVTLCGVKAASPTFQQFYGTNGIKITTNGNVVQVDGIGLTNGASAVYFTTNLFATNIYVSNILSQNITVQSNLFVNNSIITNLTVVQNTYLSNVFVTNNLFVQNNSYISNIFVTNIFAGDIITTNLYATNIFVDNFYATNIITTNLTVNNTVTENLFVTTNITVVQNAYISNIVTEVNQTVINITSNLYVTNIIAGTIISKDILWTNDNGTVRLIDESRIGLGTNAGDAMILVENGTNAINAFKYSTNGLTLFMVKSNGDLSTIRGVAYAWPNAQGGAGTALTNDGSGNLGWWAVSSAGGGLGMIRSNIFTTNVQGSPVVGSLWLQGLTGDPVTNGARTAFEYIPSKQSLRIGSVAGNTFNGIVVTSLSVASNFWDATNIGLSSFALGSNNMVRGEYSSIMGGKENTIETNANLSFIGGGGQNFIRSNVHNAFIGGGTNNAIISTNGTTVTKGNAIVGGGDNVIRGAGTQFAFIGGGVGNNIGSINSPQNNSEYSVISGGSVNSAFGSYLVIGGGANNSMSSFTTTFPTYSTIGGGSANLMLAASGSAADGSTIAGGRNNQIGTGANGAVDDAVISGGTANLIDAAVPGGGVIGGGAGNFLGFNNHYAVISGGKSNQIQNSLGASFIMGGTSNNVTAFGGVIGFWTTNATSEQIRIGVFNTNAVAFDRYGAKADGQVRIQAGRSGTYAAAGGTLTNSVGPIVNAGATETNLMTYTVTANVLTNNGDRLVFWASGRFNANGNNKQLKAIWGSETILDTTAQAANSGAWVIQGEIIRTGNTAQFASASYTGNGVTLFTTANSKPLVQTNGIATVLKISGTATADGDITNNTFTVEYRPTFPNQ